MSERAGGKGGGGWGGWGQSCLHGNLKHGVTDVVHPAVRLLSPASLSCYPSPSLSCPSPHCHCGAKRLFKEPDETRLHGIWAILPCSSQCMLLPPPPPWISNPSTRRAIRLQQLNVSHSFIKHLMLLATAE